jgi:hypothetical protein
MSLNLPLCLALSLLLGIAAPAVCRAGDVQAAAPAAISAATLPAGQSAVQALGGEREVGPVRFPTAIQLAQGPILLRGTRMAGWLGFKLYAIALYFDPATPAADLYSAGKPVRVVLHYLRNISRQQFIDHTEKFIRIDPANDMQALRKRLDDLYTHYHDVKAGDEFAITWQPGVGTHIAQNGGESVQIPGDDFARALLNIWLGDRPSNKKGYYELFEATRPPLPLAARPATTPAPAPTATPQPAK